MENFSFQQNEGGKKSALLIEEKNLRPHKPNPVPVIVLNFFSQMNPIILPEAILTPSEHSKPGNYENSSASHQKLVLSEIDRADSMCYSNKASLDVRQGQVLETWTSSSFFWCTYSNMEKEKRFRAANQAPAYCCVCSSHPPALRQRSHSDHIPTLHFLFCQTIFTGVCFSSYAGWQNVKQIFLNCKRN